MRKTVVVLLVLIAVHVVALASGSCRRSVVAAAAHVEGAGGSLWRTDLVLHNPSDVAIEVTPSWLPTVSSGSAGNPIQGVGLRLDPKQTTVLPDAMAGLFPMSPGTVASGAIVIDAVDTNGALAPVVVDSSPDNATVVRAFDRTDHWFGSENHRSVVQEVEFPRAGDWDQVGLRLRLECPESGLCDHWDRTGSLQLVLNPSDPEDEWEHPEIMRQDLWLDGERRSVVPWRTDCEHNPVKNQQGTWTCDRNGWCPGAITIGDTVDITDMVTPGETATLDFDIRLADGSEYENTNPGGGLTPIEWVSLQIYIYRD